MRVHTYLAAFALMGLVGCAGTQTRPAGQGSPQPASLDAVLGEIAASPALEGAQASIMVRDAISGRILWQHAGYDRRQPASNEKLLTSMAALAVLGPGYQFETRVWATGSVRDGVLAGDIYLQGTGDPTLKAEDIANLAQSLVDQGVHRVRGGLKIDDTWFDTKLLGANWSWDDEAAAYSAPVSAMNFAIDDVFDINAVNVVVQPAPVVNQPARAVLEPATTQLVLANRAVTGDGGRLFFNRVHGTSIVEIDGTIAPGSSAQSSLVSVVDPAAAVAGMFRSALAARGIAIDEGTQVHVAVPPDAQRMATRLSIPLIELSRPFLKLSNNGHAEVLVKAMGRKRYGQGTWDAGLRAMGEFLRSQGVDPASLKLSDGSGLSRLNQVTPWQITQLLIAARHQPWFAQWQAALPVAGNPERLVGGTLRSRMAGTLAANNVHAKTGSLTGVSGLSGYVDTAKGRPLVFSMLTNNFVVPSARIKELEDRLAVALAECGAQVICD